MAEVFLKAMCLLLVLEGVLPFLFPSRWRGAVLKLAEASDRQLRQLGLTSMLLGAGFLYLLS